MALKRTVAKNASKTFSPTTEKRETYPKLGATRSTATRGTARKAGTITNNAPKTGFSMGETTEARTSYAGGAVSGGLGRKVSRPLTSSKMRANPRPTNPKAVTQHMASKSKKYTY